MKFIHAVDMHLDSALHVRKSAPVEEIRGASRRAFDNLTELVIDEEETAQTYLIGISAITLWEIALLAESGRLRLGVRWECGLKPR